MQSLIYIMTLFVYTILSLPSFAQLKNTKTETVKINGNCGMCKKIIEGTGNIKKEAEIQWDKSTQIATITYDTTKSDLDNILKRIALAGYDNEKYLAPDDVYENLHECCIYDRELKSNEVNSQSPDHQDHKTNVQKPSVDHSQHNKSIVENSNKLQLQSIFENYFKLKDALIIANSKQAAVQAQALWIAVKQINMEELSVAEHTIWMKIAKDLSLDSEHIEKSKDISHQRDHFVTLSKNIYALRKVTSLDKQVYYQYCPMYNNGKGAHWLSEESSIRNPYFGAQMMTCGKTIETIQ